MRKAVKTRDAALDGRFLYGVITTGVCCRPVCRSRPPRPENLRFFADLPAAQAAGFRPCKRCRPDQASTSLETRVLAAARFLIAHPDTATGLRGLARQVHWSPAHLQRRFKAELGCSPRQFQEAVRLGRLRQLLRRRAAIGRALLDAGFGSHSEGYRAVAQTLGMAPAVYQRGATAEILEYAAAHSSLGWVMLAATARGVCYAQFGTSAAALRQDLAAEFPGATLRESTDGRVDRWLAELLEAIEVGRSLQRIPLDLRGTAFQVRVWQALRRVAVGRTRSYAELAAGIGQPEATRAVASACARNRIAVIVPCHRIVRGDGGLAGYRWGVKRKQALLDRESGRS
jgi:AraC family transcriptional regulator of adaptative response/methylated-DNA-[protein]-cysteine methyltransferase